MKKKNILLVDDDEIGHFLCKKTLASIGLINELSVALNGKQALKVFTEYIQGLTTLPDVIFLDLNMPIMDGFEFIEAYQQIDFPGKDNVLIVILTSSADSSDIQRAKDMGIQHYLTKPLTAEAVKSIFIQEEEGEFDSFAVEPK